MTDPIMGHAVSLTVALIAKSEGVPSSDVVQKMLDRMFEIVLHTMDTPAADKPPGGRQLTEEEIKATITEDGQHLISLEDGKKYKSLRSHLKSFGLTPEQYRAKWGLPDIYPMNSVAFSMARRDAALAAGLGKKGAGKK